MAKLLFLTLFGLTFFAFLRDALNDRLGSSWRRSVHLVAVPASWAIAGVFLFTVSEDLYRSIGEETVRGLLVFWLLSLAGLGFANWRSLIFVAGQVAALAYALEVVLFLDIFCDGPPLCYPPFRV